MVKTKVQKDLQYYYYYYMSISEKFNIRKSILYRIKLKHNHLFESVSVTGCQLYSMKLFNPVQMRHLGYDGLAHRSQII